MNVGVGTAPCGVCSMPARAAPSVAAIVKVMLKSPCILPRFDLGSRIKCLENALMAIPVLGHGPGADLAHADPMTPAAGGDDPIEDLAFSRLLAGFDLQPA